MPAQRDPGHYTVTPKKKKKSKAPKPDPAPNLQSSYSSGGGGGYESSAAIGGGAEVAASEKAAKKAAKAAKRRARSASAGVVSTSERKAASKSTRKTAGKRSDKQHAAFARKVGIAQAYRGTKRPTTTAERRAAAKGRTVRSILKEPDPGSDKTQVGEGLVYQRYQDTQSDLVRANQIATLKAINKDRKADLAKTPKSYVAGAGLRTSKLEAEIATNRANIKRLKLQQVKKDQRELHHYKQRIRGWKTLPRADKKAINKELRKRTKDMEWFRNKEEKLTWQVGSTKGYARTKRREVKAQWEDTTEFLQHAFEDNGDITNAQILRDSGVRVRHKKAAEAGKTNDVEVKIPGGEWMPFELAEKSSALEDAIEPASYIASAAAAVLLPPIGIPAFVARVAGGGARPAAAILGAARAVVRPVSPLLAPAAKGIRLIGTPLAKNAKALGRVTSQVGGKAVVIGGKAAQAAGIGPAIAKIASRSVINRGGRRAAAATVHGAERQADELVRTQTGATLVRSPTVERGGAAAQNWSDEVANAMDRGLIGMAMNISKGIPSLSGWSVASRTIGEKVLKGAAITTAGAYLPQLALGQDPAEAAKLIYRNAYDLVVSAVPSTYEAAAATWEALPLTEGDWSRAEKMKDEFFKYSALGLSLTGDFEGALEAYKERPFTTMLEVAGVEYVAGRVLGAGMRTFGTPGMQRAASMSDLSKQSFGRSVEIGRYSPDIFRKGVTKAWEKASPEKTKRRRAQALEHRRVDGLKNVHDANKIRMQEETDKALGDIKREAEAIANGDLETITQIREEADPHHIPEFQRSYTAVELAKDPKPGTVIWRAETRHDPLDMDTGIGIHWTTEPGAVMHMQMPADEHPGRRVVYQAVIDDPDSQVIPRTHPIWSGRSRSMEWEAEVRPKPNANLRVLGAWVWKDENDLAGISRGFYPPNRDFNADGKWEWHPINEAATMFPRGHINYDRFPDLFSNEDVGMSRSRAESHFPTREERTRGAPEPTPDPTSENVIHATSAGTAQFAIYPDGRREGEVPTLGEARAAGYDAIIYHGADGRETRVELNEGNVSRQLGDNESVPPASERGSNALPFMASRMARNPKEAENDLRNMRNDLEATLHGDRIDTESSDYTRATIGIIDEILEHPEFLKDQRLWDIADRWSENERARQEALIDVTSLSKHQTEAAAWIPYIVRHLGGHPSGDGHLWDITPVAIPGGEHGGRVKVALDLSKPADIQWVREYAASENVAEPAFVSMQGLDNDYTIPQMPHINGRAVRFNHRTGQAIEFGTFDPTFNNLYAHTLRVNHIIMDADFWRKVVKERSVFSRSVTGEVLYHGTREDNVNDILEQGFNTDEVWLADKGQATYHAGDGGGVVATDVDTRDYIKYRENEDGGFDLLTHEAENILGADPVASRIDPGFRQEILAAGYKGIITELRDGGKRVVVLDKTTIGNIRIPKEGLDPDIVRERLALNDEEVRARVSTDSDLGVDFTYDILPFLKEPKGEPGVTIEPFWLRGYAGSEGAEDINYTMIVSRDENGDPVSGMMVHHPLKYKDQDGNIITHNDLYERWDEDNDRLATEAFSQWTNRHGYESFIDKNDVTNVTLGTHEDHRRQGHARAIVKAAKAANIPIWRHADNVYSQQGNATRTALLNEAEDILGVEGDKASPIEDYSQVYIDSRKNVQKRIDREVRAGELQKGDVVVVNAEVLVQRMSALRGLGEDLPGETGTGGERGRYDNATSSALADALDEGQKGHNADKPQWVAMPASTVKRLRMHAKIDDAFFNSTAGRRVRRFNRMYKGAVLPFNPRWGLGNMMDMSFRMMMDQSGGPVQWAINWNRGRRILNRIKKRSPDAYWQLMESIGHGFMTESMQSILEDKALNPQARRQAIEQFQLHSNNMGWMNNPQDRALVTQRAIHMARGLPSWVDKGARAYRVAQEGVVNVKGVPVPINPFGFRVQRGIEKHVRIAAFGKADRQLMGELKQKWEEAMLITPNAIEDETLRLSNSNVVTALAERVNGVLGDYSRMSPAMRTAVMSYSPFALWARAAITWMWTLSTKHPLQTAFLSAMEGVTEAERADKGQSMLNPVPEGEASAKHGMTPTVAPFALGSIPGIGDNTTMQTGTLTSFGTLYDPGISSAADFVAPQLSSIYLTAAGLSWTGQQLVYPSGRPMTGAAERTGFAFMALTETMLPFTRWWKVYKAEGAPDETATFWNPKPYNSLWSTPEGEGMRSTYVSPYQSAPAYEAAPRNVLGQLFNPLRSFPTKPEGTKPLPPPAYGAAAAAAGTDIRKTARKAQSEDAIPGLDDVPENLPGATRTPKEHRKKKSKQGIPGIDY